MLRLLLLYHCPALCRRLDEFELRPDLYATRFNLPTNFSIQYTPRVKVVFCDLIQLSSWLVTMMAADLEINILLRLWDGKKFLRKKIQLSEKIPARCRFLAR